MRPVRISFVIRRGAALPFGLKFPRPISGKAWVVIESRSGQELFDSRRWPGSVEVGADFIRIVVPERATESMSVGNCGLDVYLDNGMALVVASGRGRVAPVGAGGIGTLRVIGDSEITVDTETRLTDPQAAIPGPPGEASNVPGPQGPSGVDQVRRKNGDLINILNKILRFDDRLDIFEDDEEAFILEKHDLCNQKYKAFASSQNTTVTTTADSTTITLASNPDFAKRHGVVIFGRGADPALTTPLIPTAELKCWSIRGQEPEAVTNGTVTMQFCWMAVDGDFACSAASPVVTVEDCPDYFGVASNVSVRRFPAVITENVDMSNVSRFRTVDNWRIHASNVVLTGQIDKTEVGAWQVEDINDASFSLDTRSTIMNSTTEFALGARIHIFEGEKYGHSFWRVFKAPGTIGTDEAVIAPEVYCELSYPTIECSTVTTGPVTLSGIQTINGVAGADGRVVLVAHGASQGPYTMRSGAWEAVGVSAVGRRARIGVIGHGFTANRKDLGSYWVEHATGQWRRENWKHLVVYARRSTDGGETYGSWFLASAGLAEPQPWWKPFVAYRGNPSIASPASILPTQPPSTTVRGVHRTRIRTINGLTAVLDDAPLASGSGARMYHDNWKAFEDRVDDCSPPGSSVGGVMELPGAEDYFLVWKDMVWRKAMWFKGTGPESTKIKFGPGCGLLTENQHYSPDGGSAAQCRIEGIAFEGWSNNSLLPAGALFIDQDGWSQGALVLCRTTTSFIYGSAQGCVGTCLALVGDSSLGTNANRSFVAQIRVGSNLQGHGMYDGGDNANVLLDQQLDAVNVDGHGRWSTNLLGMCSIIPHFSACAGYPIYHDGGPAVVVSPYTELNQSRLRGSGSLVVVGRTVTGMDDSHGDMYIHPGYISPHAVPAGAPDAADQYLVQFGSLDAAQFRTIRRAIGTSQPCNYEEDHDGAGGVRTSWGLTTFPTCRMGSNDFTSGLRAGLMNFEQGFTFGAGTRRRQVRPMLTSAPALGRYQVGDIVLDLASSDAVVKVVTAEFGIGAVWSNRNCRIGDVVYPTSTWDDAHPGHNNRAWYVRSFTVGTSVDQATIGPTEPDWSTSDSAGSDITVGGCVLRPLPPDSRTAHLQALALVA